jgi:carboxyl-terminal processing protease
MRSKIEKLVLLTVGAIVGVMLSLNYSANAEKNPASQLPIDALRTFESLWQSEIRLCRKSR